MKPYDLQFGSEFGNVNLHWFRLRSIILRILVHLIRMVYFPKGDWLLRQYREATE